MSPEAIQHVQETWREVEAIAPEAARLFYHNLFTADPSLRSLFKGDMEGQGTRLTEMIGVAVRELEHPAALTPVLRALGKRHAAYGVRPVHYQTVGEALLQTLAEGLGDRFSPNVRDAWAAVYGLVAETMLAGAADAAEA